MPDGQKVPHKPEKTCAECERPRLLAPEGLAVDVVPAFVVVLQCGVGGRKSLLGKRSRLATMLEFYDIQCRGGTSGFLRGACSAAIVLVLYVSETDILACCAGRNGRMLMTRGR